MAICELCGETFIKKSNVQKNCGSQKEKGSCSYKAFIEKKREARLKEVERISEKRVTRCRKYRNEAQAWLNE